MALSSPALSPAALDRAFARRLGAPRPPAAGSLLGIEHEYRVLDGDGAAVDFRTLLHDLPVPGRRLDPGDPNAYRWLWGALTADEREAEVASPPLDVVRGVGLAAAGWAASAAGELAGLLPDGLCLEGFSTHLSVALPEALGDRAALLYAATFAPALMLLLDGPDSPGLLVRPRPGRLELGGDFATGDRLRAAAVFAAGSVRAVAAASALGPRAALSRRRLPPAVEVRLAPAVERFGWFVSRSAFGPDLYAGGRATPLRLRHGGTISAGEHLRRAWVVARRALGRDLGAEDAALVEAFVAGIRPLGVDESAGPDTELRPETPAQAPLADPLLQLLEAVRRPGYELSAELATWQTAVLRLRSGDRTAFATLPAASLQRFIGLLEGGALDRLLVAYLAAPVAGRRLDAQAAARGAGLFDSVAHASAIAAVEREPLFPGAATDRRGKRREEEREEEAEETSEEGSSQERARDQQARGDAAAQGGLRAVAHLAATKPLLLAAAGLALVLGAGGVLAATGVLPIGPAGDRAGPTLAPGAGGGPTLPPGGAPTVGPGASEDLGDEVFHYEVGTADIAYSGGLAAEARGIPLQVGSRQVGTIRPWLSLEFALPDGGSTVSITGSPEPGTYRLLPPGENEPVGLQLVYQVKDVSGGPVGACDVVIDYGPDGAVTGSFRCPDEVSEGGYGPGYLASGVFRTGPATFGGYAVEESPDPGASGSPGATSLLRIGDTAELGGDRLTLHAVALAEVTCYERPEVTTAVRGCRVGEGSIIHTPPELLIDLTYCVGEGNPSVQPLSPELSSPLPIWVASSYSPVPYHARAGWRYYGGEVSERSLDRPIASGACDRGFIPFDSGGGPTIFSWGDDPNADDAIRWWIGPGEPPTNVTMGS